MPFIQLRKYALTQPLIIAIGQDYYHCHFRFYIRCYTFFLFFKGCPTAPGNRLPALGYPVLRFIFAVYKVSYVGRLGCRSMFFQWK